MTCLIRLKPNDISHSLFQLCCDYDGIAVQFLNGNCLYDRRCKKQFNVGNFNWIKLRLNVAYVSGSTRLDSMVGTCRVASTDKKRGGHVTGVGYVT